MIDKSFQGLILSLAIHALALWFMAKVPPHSETSLSQRQPIEISLSEPKAQKKQTFVTETEEKDLLKELRDKADLLSQLTKRVKEQTRARLTGATRNRAGTAPVEADEAREQGGGGSNTNQAIRGPTATDSELRNRAQTHPGSGPFGPQVVVGASTMGEYIPGVKEGAFTALNTDRFTYYTFFARLNEQIRPRWISLVRNFANGLGPSNVAVLAEIERSTEIEIVLDRSGGFLKSYIYKSSGFRELDEAAVKAFSSAAPFPNPPQAMIEADGAIHLRYGFVVQWQPHHLAVGK